MPVGAVKRCVSIAARASVLGSVWRCRLLAKLIGRDRAVAMVGESAAKWPGLWGVYRRAAFYHAVLARVGEDVSIGFGSVVTKADAELGDRVYVGRYCGIGRARIEADALLADAVQVLSGRHQHGRASREGAALRDNAHRYERVTVGRGAWLGASSVVMADVGPRSVVAAGAVVVKPTGEAVTVAGVPARALEPAAPRAAA